MRRVGPVVLLSMFVVLVLGAPASAQASYGLLRPAPYITRPRTRLPHLRPQSISYSSNWSGFAAVAQNGRKLRYIVADFNIPAVDCTRTPGAHSSDWVGLDGFTRRSNTVEQAGTDSDCSGTSPYYDAWYEMYPLYPVVYSGVSPGDAIQVSVYWNGSSFQLTLIDVTRNTYFAVSKRCPSGRTCLRNSAEVVTEDDSDLPHNANDLADFGMENFTEATVTSSTDAHGTLMAKRGYWSSSKMVMVDKRNKILATPSSLYGGQAFNVVWKRCC